MDLILIPASRESRSSSPLPSACPCIRSHVEDTNCWILLAIIEGYFEMIVGFPIDASSDRMECSGPDVSSCLEDDWATSEEHESVVVDHWPELSLLNPPQSSLLLHIGLQMDTTSNGTEQPADASCDNSDSANNKLFTLPRVPSVFQWCLTYLSQPPLPRPGVCISFPTRTLSELPTFALRDIYFKLSFSGNSSMDTKLRWLSAVKRTFHCNVNLLKSGWLLSPPGLHIYL